jgi:hypothetical protein
VGPLCGAGTLTFQEYRNRIFVEFAGVERVCLEVIPDLNQTISSCFRPAFERAIDDALSPQFQWHPFSRGGSFEEIAMDRDLRIARVRAWAAAFRKFWDVQ